MYIGALSGAEPCKPGKHSALSIYCLKKYGHGRSCCVTTPSGTKDCVSCCPGNHPKWPWTCGRPTPDVKHCCKGGYPIKGGPPFYVKNGRCWNDKACPGTGACTQNSDCPPGQVCKDGHCRPGGGAPKPCPPCTHWDPNVRRCVKTICPPGFVCGPSGRCERPGGGPCGRCKYWNQYRQSCMPIECPPGYACNPQTNQCEPGGTTQPCPPCYVWNSAQGTCRPRICPTNFQCDPNTNQCVPVMTQLPPTHVYTQTRQVHGLFFSDDGRLSPLATLALVAGAASLFLRS